MVKTNIQTFSGEVEILSNLHVGSYLTANGAASNVLDITGNVGATFFVGDGGFLSNIATTLSDIVNQGNVVSNVVTFEGNTNYAGVGLVTSSNVGIQNTNPLHTLSIGDKIRVNNNTDESLGESVIEVDGRILATRFEGDGGLLSNIATTLESIVNQGNVSANVVKFSSNALVSEFAGAGLVTDSNVGIQNTAPTYNLSVGSNLHVNDTGSNVLTVHGNVVASNLNLGVFSITPAYGLNEVCNTSNGTTNVVQFQNGTTSLVASSNITASGNITAQTIISGSNVEIADRLKFTGNVFIDTLRVADVAANLVTYDRVTGELTDSGGTFLNKFAIVSEQPPSDLFANATTVANHGGYTLTTSNLATNSNTFNAFDGTANAWVSGDLAGGYIGGANVFHENNLTQLSNLHPTQRGDWLAIEFPYKTTLRHMKLTPLTAAQFPASANIYATNNDLTWTEVNYWKDVNPVTASNVQTITVNATEQFKKYALVATKAAGDSSNVAIQDWQLFTESFSIDGGKVAMAQQAATGGETVMDQHGPHSRGAAKLKKYPEIAFDASKLDGNDSTNTYVQAGYTVTGSGFVNSSNHPWKAFNGIDFEVGMLLSGLNYDTSGNANTSGTTASRLSASDSTPYGEWLKLELPNKIKLDKYVFTSRNHATHWAQGPEAGQVWGSNDDSNWVHLHTFTNSGFTGESQSASFDVQTDNYYKYYAFIVTKTFAAGTDYYLCVPELKFYGYEEDPPLGDTSVDTTFTSIMNTPQTTGAQVYVDGSLGETFTNRVVGPTVSNTHTTYVSAEKYWELSGNVESNVTLEANTFLSGDAPHSVSMWFNSSNLEANASNSCIFSLGTEERLDHVGVAFSNTYQTVQKLLSSDLEANDRFGYAVAMNSDGTKFIVGAFVKDDDVGNIADAGAAYIYTYNGSSWDEQKLMSPDIEASARFGWSVSMNSDGTKVIVGASFNDEGATSTGAAYIFTYSGGSWDAGTKIVALDKEQEDYFGYSVAMSGDGNKVIVGAYLEDDDLNDQNSRSNAGSAYIYTYDGSNWDTGTKIIASDRAVDDIFGRSVAINSNGTKVIVGAEGGEAAYIFTYNGSSWVQQQILVASDGAAGDKFGWSVGMNSNGTKVIVGAYLEDPGNLSDAGAAYIYTYDGSNWDTGTKIVAPDKEAGDVFGISVAMNSDGTKVIVGAYLEHAGGITDAGAAYIFAYDGSNWDTGLKITAPDKEASDQFSSGTGVAMSGDGARVVVGANLDDVFSANSGAVYVYDRDTTHHLMTDLKLQSNTWHNLTYAYQGEGGSRVTYLDGRKVAEDQAEDTFGDYPPFAMSGYSQGGYVASASSFAGSVGVAPAWKAFDDLPLVTGSDITSPYWQSMTDTYNSSGNWVSGVGATGVQFTDTNSGQHSGEWIKLEMPHKLKLSYISYLCTYAAYMPKNFVILGSNDDNTWTLLKSVTGGTSAEDVYHNLTINANRSYKYYVWLTSAITGTGGEVLFANIKYYGHRENDLVRLPDPTNVLKYPHIPFALGRGGYLDASGSTPKGEQSYSLRGYTVTSSSNYGNGSTDTRSGWNAFDEGNGGTTYSIWQSGAYYTSASPGVYNRSPPERHTAGGVNYDGEWIKLELPHKINVTGIEINSAAYDDLTSHIIARPYEGAILGSNDGSKSGTWDLLKAFSGGLTWTTTTVAEGGGRVTLIPDTNTGNAYKYLVLIVNKNEGSRVTFDINEIRYYGTGVDSVPIQIGGGNIDKVANFRVYDKFVGEDQALEIWDAQKDTFGRAKSSMTLHKGRLGIGTTEPEGRLAVADEPDPDAYGLQKFPPKPLHANETHIEGHGIFRASASRETSTTVQAWEAFDEVIDVSSGWDSAGGVDQYSESTGAYIGNDVTTTIDGGQISGTFIQLEMPYKVKLQSISIMPQKMASSDPNFYGGARMLKTGSIVGSNDGVNWYLIASIGQTVYYDGILTPFQTASTTFYSYFRLIAQTITQGANSTWRNRFNLSEFKLFGTREQVTKQSVLHDGQLTLTKNLTVPRIGPALDADDTPRRDRLVVEYNTSTNPTFDGAVRDTSGRGNDGVFVGTASYDTTEKNLVTPGNASSAITSGILKHLEGQPTLSYAFWFNQTATNGNNAMIVNLSAEGNYGYPGIGGVFIFSNGIMTTTYGGVGIQLDSALSTGTWRHVVAVCDGPSGVDNMTIYINGEKPAQSNWGTVGSIQNLVTPRLRIGGAASGTTDMFDGKISNFKLYDTALTAEEVKTLYDMGRCDEGHHVVNFSKTRVGIGLGDGEAPRAALDVRGDIKVKNIQKNFAINKDGDIGNVDMFLKCSRDTYTAGGGMTIETGTGGKYWRMIASDYLSRGWLAFGYSTNNTSWVDRGYINPGSGNSQMNFTGQHRTFIRDVPFSQVRDLEGLVVSSDQNKYIKMSGGIEAGSNAITTNESLPIVSLSNVVTDKKCFGVISASEDPETREEIYGNFGSVFEKEKGDTRIYINSVGEGAIWVSNIGGNLESGDYITTSNIAGYGQKQDDDVLHNYTVAKITMDCDFEPATQPVQQILRSNVIQTYYLGNVHKVKSVPHEFVTTTVGADDTWSNVSVSPSDVTYAEWSNLEANTQNTYNLTYTQTSNVVYDTKYTLTTTANVTESDAWDRVFVDPPTVTYAEYSNLEANTQNTYTLTYTQTTTDEKTPDQWSTLESNVQSLYNKVYYQSVEEEVAATWPGATTHTRLTDVIENELDAHGQIQWEDHPTETEKAYKIRYLDASGAQTDEANAVHIAAFVGCTYHCG
jgi:hypothetical protein